MPITFDGVTITVVGGTESSPYTFEDIYQADVSNGWGVVSKQGDNQYHFTCILKIGDGNTGTWLADTNKEISFTGLLAGFDVKDGGHFRLGEIIDEADRTTSGGCYLYLASPYGYNMIRLYGSGTLELFSSTLNGNADIKIEMNSDESRISIWNSLLLHTYTSANGGMAKADLCRVTVQQTSGILLNFLYGNDISITDSDVGLRLSDVVSPLTVANVKIINETTSISCSWVTTNVYIINTECKWTLEWVESSGRIHRQYTFNLRVIDEAGNPISNAKVRMHDKDGNLVFEETTDMNGKIPEQIITRGYYDQDHGSGLVDFAPLTLEIVKEGLKPYRKSFIPEKAIDWTIKLEHEDISIDEEVLL